MIARVSEFVIKCTRLRLLFAIMNRDPVPLFGKSARNARADAARRACNQYGVFHTHILANAARQRNAALEQAAALGADWVFFVDADERATPELAAEIRQVIAERPEVGWGVPRWNTIVGKRVNHGGFYPDYQLRLMRVDRARYDLERPVHEVVLLDGPSGHLQNPLIHYNYDTWAQFHAKQRRYAAYEARILAERGISPRPHNFILQPLREFRRRYLTLQGYRDGLHGLKLCLLLAYYYGAYPYWVLVREARSNARGPAV